MCDRKYRRILVAKINTKLCFRCFQTTQNLYGPLYNLFNNSRFFKGTFPNDFSARYDLNLVVDQN